MRYGFIRRIAFLLALLVAFAVGGATFLFWLLASLLGAVDLPGTFERGAVLVALLFGLAGIVLTARAVRRLAGPVGEVIEAAERLESGDLAARAEVQGPREVRALARAFNAMAARLETNEAQRKRLLADVTHELRTPLTIAQGDLEALLDGVYPADEAHLRAILQETHVLARLIDDLRTLSLAETGALALHREPTGRPGTDARDRHQPARERHPLHAARRLDRRRAGPRARRRGHLLRPGHRLGHPGRCPAPRVRALHQVGRLAGRRPWARDREEPRGRAWRRDPRRERTRGRDAHHLHAAGRGLTQRQPGELTSSIWARWSLPEKSTYSDFHSAYVSSAARPASRCPFPVAFIPPNGSWISAPIVPAFT